LPARHTPFPQLPEYRTIRAALILLVHERTMRSFIILVLLVAVVALGISVYDATVSPAASVPGTKAAPTSITGARVFLLLPDGKVEVTDAWARRVFQWDGSRWVEHESKAVSSAQVDGR
jgi:hypothetical protein